MNSDQHVHWSVLCFVSVVHCSQFSSVVLNIQYLKYGIYNPPPCLPRSPFFWAIIHQNLSESSSFVRMFSNFIGKKTRTDQTAYCVFSHRTFWYDQSFKGNCLLLYDTTLSDICFLFSLPTSIDTIKEFHMTTAQRLQEEKAVNFDKIFIRQYSRALGKYLTINLYYAIYWRLLVVNPANN